MRLLLLIGITIGLSGCAALDVTGSVEYQGIRVSGGRVGGRSAVNVDVDPKQIVRALAR